MDVSQIHSVCPPPPPPPNIDFIHCVESKILPHITPQEHCCRGQSARRSLFYSVFYVSGANDNCQICLPAERRNTIDKSDSALYESPSVERKTDLLCLEEIWNSRPDHYKKRKWDSCRCVQTVNKKKGKLRRVECECVAVNVYAGVSLCGRFPCVYVRAVYRNIILGVSVSRHGGRGHCGMRQRRGGWRERLVVTKDFSRAHK